MVSTQEVGRTPDELASACAIQPLRGTVTVPVNAFEPEEFSTEVLMEAHLVLQTTEPPGEHTLGLYCPILQMYYQ